MSYRTSSATGLYLSTLIFLACLQNVCTVLAWMLPGCRPRVLSSDSRCRMTL